MSALSEPGREKIDPARWDRLKSILIDAMEETSPAARTALIERCCAEDAALLREAASLLAHAESLLAHPVDSLEECAVNATASLWKDNALQNGRRLGAYVIIRELGRGGMGAVYLAARADGQFEKQVAIKLLKRGTDTDEVLRRFGVERHILARLEHPNVARILDAGTSEDGLPYFVMEYVDGVPVTRFVRDEAPSTEARLRLFLKICAAVEFAHKNRVLHRDLKPTNILVKSDGEPKLLDFGIAKLLSPGENNDEITAPLRQHLSLVCASPEQARGDPLTVASDVYALGALLYEMLTGAAPHNFGGRAHSQEEFVRVVCEEDPPAPSLVVTHPETRRELRGNLDSVVLMAMRKEPALRYSSVAEFAADITRHLEGQPLLARRRTVASRLLRFRNRRGRSILRPFALAAVFVFLALVAGTVFKSNFDFARWTALISGKGAIPNVPDKSIAVLPFTNLSDEKENVFFADGVKDEVMTNLARVADLKVVKRSGAIADGPLDLDELRRTLKVAHVLEGSVRRSGNRVRVTAKLIDTRSQTQLWAETYDRELANVFAIQSEIAESIVHQLQARLLPGEKADIEERATNDLAAYDLYLRGKEIVNSYVDTPDPAAAMEQAVRLLKEATERDPDFTVAYCYLARAHSLLSVKTLDPYKIHFAQAEQAAQKALHLRPQSAEAHLAMAEVYLRCHGDFELAEKELALAGPGLPNSAPFYAISGHVRRRQGRWDQAERDFAKAAELDPTNSNAVIFLADTQILVRDYRKAIETLERARSRGIDPPELSFRIAVANFASTGNLEKLRVTLAAVPKNLDTDGQHTPLRILIALADSDPDRAVAELAASSRSVFQDVDGSFYYPRAWYAAIIARARGDLEQAGIEFAAAKGIFEERLKVRPRAPRTHASLAQAYAGIGLKELAIEETKAAVALLALEKDAYLAPLVEQTLAQAYVWTDQKEEALNLIEKLVRAPGYLSYGFLKIDPVWQPLRGDERFQQLLASLEPGAAPAAEGKAD